MGNLTLSPRARQDLKDISRFTRKTWGDRQRLQYLTQLNRCFERIADTPMIGMAREEIRSGYYSILVGQHVVFYRRTTDGVEVIRVLHQRMDIKHQVP